LAPKETYISWTDNYAPKDMKFICLYGKSNTVELEVLRKTVLHKNPLFVEEKEFEDYWIEIFDYSVFKDDWENFVHGKFSKFTYRFKASISKYFGTNSSNSVYIDSFINPQKYFYMYAQILDVPVKLLKEVGELCDKPDMEKENLNINTLIYDKSR